MSKARSYADEIAAMLTRMLVADGEEVIITAEGDGTLVVNCEGVAATVYYDAYDGEWKAVV